MPNWWFQTTIDINTQIVIMDEWTPESSTWEDSKGFILFKPFGPFSEHFKTPEISE